MRIKVNTRTLQIIEGACVKNALLRYFSVKKLDKKLIDGLEVYDAYGHVIDHAYDRDHQTQGIEDFNDYIARDDRVEQVILPLRDGLTLIRKK